MNLYDLAIAKKLAGGGGGGGGASNIVTGTFKGTEDGAMEVSIPYTGSGWPVNVMIAPVKGFYNPNGGDYSALVQQNAVGVFALTKRVPDGEPTWTAISNNNNKGAAMVYYKNSSTSATSYKAIGQYDFLYYYPTNAGSADVDKVLRIKSPTVLSVNISSTGTGFAKDIEYTYTIQYSS